MNRAGVILILVDGVEHETDLVLLQVHSVDQVGELVARLALLLDHTLNVRPSNARADHHRENVDDGLCLESMLQEQLRLKL